MPYKVRFLQRFPVASKSEFLNLEEKYTDLERRYPEFPKARRFLPYASGEATNTLICELEFATVQEADAAIEFFAHNPHHDEIFKLQSEYMLDCRTEIYEEILVEAAAKPSPA